MADTPTPDATTGAPIVNLIPPAPVPPAPAAEVGKPPHMDGIEEEEVVRDTAVQGSADTE